MDEEGPFIDWSLLFVFIFLTCVCLVALLFFGSMLWPLSHLQVLLTVLGALVGLFYCVDRVFNWDVQQWQWHQAERNRVYSRAMYIVGGLGGVCGMVTASILRDQIRPDIFYGVLAAAALTMSIVCGWSVIECVGHFWYHARSRR